MIAVTLDQLASLHESVAEAEQHPLYEGARSRAVTEREAAQKEREASVWFSAIAAGTYRPETWGELPSPRSPYQ